MTQRQNIDRELVKLFEIDRDASDKRSVEHSVLSKRAMAERYGESWSDDDVAKLAELYFKTPRMSADVIANQIGRTKQAVHAEISRLGMSRPGAKLRTCIGAECYGRRTFFSVAPGHRICPRCAQLEVYRCAS